MQRPNTSDGLFHPGNPMTGEKGTPVSSEWLNALLGLGAFLSGNTEPPANELGGPGDFYLCTADPLNLYGPKMSDPSNPLGLWPDAPATLRGPQSPPFHSGSGSPVGTGVVAAIGEWYLDLSGYNIWIKTGMPDAWALECNIRGEQGLQGGKGDPGNLTVNPQYSPKIPMITFVDDDGDVNVWTRLKPTFEAAGVPCVIALVSNWVQNGDKLTAAQALTLQAEGWEIASHSKSHVYYDLTPGVTPDSTLISELSDSKNYFAGLGLNVSHFVYPGGYYNERYAQLARNYYRSAAILDEWTNSGPLHTWTLARRHFGGNSFTLAQQKAAVDAAIASNGWIVFVTHCANATMSDQDVLDLASLIAYIQSKNVPIVTLSQGLNQLGNLLELGYFPWTANLAAGFPVNPYCVVASDGEVALNPGTTAGVPSFVAPLNGFTAASAPTDFPFGKITYTTIDSSNESGFPNSLPGTLVTMRLGNKDAAGEGWTKQTYHAYAALGTWERTWSGTGWTPWAQVIHGSEAITQVSAIDAFTADTPLTSFGLGQITYTRISTAGSATFPTATAGTLETNRALGSGGDYWGRQVYRIYQSEAYYTRHWTGTAWSTWAVAGSVPLVQVSADNAYASSDLVTAFPSSPSVTYTKINGANTAGFPQTNSGILVTTRTVTSSDQYSKQDFTFYNASVRYTRYWTGSAWSAWALTDGSIVISALDAFDANSAPTSFGYGITHTEIDAAGKATFPEASAGTLITERMFYGAEAWTRQRYTIYQSVRTYARYWTGSAWSAWSVITTDDSVGTAVASASTIIPSGRIFHVTGSATINTINLPYSGYTGSIRLIPDGTFATGTSGNIAIASAAVVGKTLTMTFDGAKWYPSY